MAVYHVLKDGSRPKDIRNHVVRKKDAEAVYRMIAEINRGKKKEEKK